MSAVLDVIVCCCCCCTVDNSARVKAAVLLAPVGSDASALWEITHGWRLYVDDLQNTESEECKNSSTDVASLHLKLSVFF